jgi:ribosomal protein S13
MPIKFKESISYFFIQNYGIGKSQAVKMCKFIDVSPYKPSYLISEVKKNLAVKLISKKNYQIGFLLKNKEFDVFLYYKKIKNIKWFKFKFFLPINGQRNKTNGRTAKKNAANLFKLLKQYTKSGSKKKIKSAKKKK